MTTDQQYEQYLKLLSIFHYVVAGLTGLFACFPIFHLAIGLNMVFGGFAAPPDEAFPFRLFGLFFVIIPAALILAGWSLAGTMAASGYFLSQRTRYMFCLVVAGIECLFMPFGTVLGVFTIVVLIQPTVKAKFGLAPSPVPSPGAEQLN